MKGAPGRREIHLSLHESREGWTSFETDPRLTRTKERLHGRCLPCLSALHEQLRETPDAVGLGFAWSCWKVVAVVDRREEALELLERFGEDHPGEYVYGKLGTGRGRASVAVMFHTEDEGRKDELLAMMRSTVDRHLPGRRVFASRGCGDPYEQLLGPWEQWKPVSRIVHRERVETVRKHLRESLYGR